MPRREGMERKDLLKANVKIFKAQGQALDQHAKKDVKVIQILADVKHLKCLKSRFVSHNLNVDNVYRCSISY